MEQTKLMLASTRQNYSQALNIICLIQMNAIPTTIEDTMYAYMVAKDWCLWIKTPGEPAENPLQSEVDDELYHMFEEYAERFEYQLLISLVDIEACVDILNPNLIELFRGRNSVWSENTRLLYRSLRYTILPTLTFANHLKHRIVSLRQAYPPLPFAQKAGAHPKYYEYFSPPDTLGLDFYERQKVYRVPKAQSLCKHLKG